MKISKLAIALISFGLIQSSVACFYSFGPLAINELVEKSEMIWVGDLKSKSDTDISVPKSCNDLFVKSEFEIDRILKGSDRFNTVHIPMANIYGIDSGTAIVFVWTYEDIKVGVVHYLENWGECEFAALIDKVERYLHNNGFNSDAGKACAG